MHPGFCFSGPGFSLLLAALVRRIGGVMFMTTALNRNERDLARRRQPFAFAAHERHAGWQGATVSAIRGRMRRQRRKAPGALDKGP
jgi:hypothetical protein